ncbi:unnamed protein product, partial [marine sediment metagenome]
AGSGATTDRRESVNSRERVFRQITGQEVDRIPLMGGWFHGARNLAALSGLSVEDYLRHPATNLIKANRALAIDCMVDPIIPTQVNQVRTAETLDADFDHIQPEDLVQIAAGIPDSAEEILASFDFQAEEAKCRSRLLDRMSLFGNIVLVPNFWESVPHFHLYSVYGYRPYLEAIALYPEAVGRIFWQDAICARARNQILIRLIRELGLPPVLFTSSSIGPEVPLQNVIAAYRYAAEG